MRAQSTAVLPTSQTTVGTGGVTPSTDDAFLALRGLRVPFLSFLPGHPCQLPARGQTFGYPELRPPAFAACPSAPPTWNERIM